ncbi:MAG: hypothetical protein EAZ55_03095 [Cytophagales bacterium]|nr:MAG: hypothetical protein EAZ55_03095 [Cytophagales bacterium]
MIRILLVGLSFAISTLTLLAQPNLSDKMKAEYQNLWKKADSLEQKGLPQSALEVVNQIYEKAKNDKQEGQQVKAIIYQMKYIAYVEEEALVKSIDKLRTEAEKATFPMKAMLHSILAESYWQYFQHNRYEFYNRTQVINYNLSDIRTWDLVTISQEVLKNYLASLQEAPLLQKVQMQIYEPILYKGSADEQLYRPTMYDFLAHRAIDFLMNTEPEVTRPAYAFYPNQITYLVEGNDFVKLTLQTEDKDSYQFNALRIFQQLTAFHLNDAKSEAFLDIELKRLKWLYGKIKDENKQTVYLEILKKLSEKHTKSPAVTEVSYAIAAIYMERASRYNPLQSEQYKWEYKTAYEICQEAKKKFPDALGAQMCQTFIDRIEGKTMELTVEMNNSPQQVFPALLEYRNIDKIYYKIIKTNRKEIEQARENLGDYDTDYEFMSAFMKKTPIQQGEFSLSNDKDYQPHKVELKIPALPIGEYIIIVSNTTDFRKDKNAVAYAFVNITEMSYVFREKAGEGATEIFLMHRNTGQPLANVQVEIIEQEYDYKKSKYIQRKLSNDQTTDAQGYVKINKVREKSYFLVFHQGEDILYSIKPEDYYGNFYNYQPYKENNTAENYTYFFTDRAIYRPGQTLYFKAILLQTEGNKHTIRPNTTITVELRDANGQKVKNISLTSNEYGTVSGNFVLPNTGLNGLMSLYESDGGVSFSVEEYKRPKFEVGFNPIVGNFKLNEIVTVIGNAKAYSGANIDGAMVKYKVERKAEFPYWWYYRYGYYPNSATVEIAYGTTQTNEKGEFTIDFKALPDPTIDPASDPTFYYTIYADVTDLNGETHSQKTQVVVGYKALTLNAQLKDNGTNGVVFSDGFYYVTKIKDIYGLEIQTKNLNGEFEPAKGTVAIYRLQSPAHAYKTRRWEQPDKYLYSQQEWEKDLPFEEYKNENNPYQWERIPYEGFAVKDFDTEKEKVVQLGNFANEPYGIYVAEIKAKDKNGMEVKQDFYFIIHNPEGNELPYATEQYSWVEKMTLEPSQTAQFVLGSSEKLWVLYEVEHQGKIIDQKWTNIEKNEIKKFQLPIQESYRGNVATHLTYVWNNQLYRKTHQFNIPWTNKELDISFETFRNKLLPGQEEEWKLKITGKQSDKVAAEMVATLYDASLDAFRKHQWSLNLYGTYSPQMTLRTENDFITTNFDLWQSSWNNYGGVSARSYNTLNWFGFSFYGFYYDDYAAEEMDEVTVGGGVQRNKNVESKREEVINPTSSIVTLNSETVEDTIVSSVRKDVGGENVNKPENEESTTEEVQVRKNFAETAFFMPQLQTNAEGEIIIKFTIPEALTKWRMMGLAHTKNLEYGWAENTLVTQKELMVVPNAPRFFRENDQMIFTSKITNLSEKDLNGTVELTLLDAISNQPIQILTAETQKTQTFKALKGQSTVVAWKIKVPANYQAITYRVVAKADNFSDGEEMTLPVLTNSMLVTETLPLPIRGNQTKTFTMDKLIASQSSTTLRNHQYTLEFTSNPTWYAVQALPYMMEFPHECAEQTFSRFYANSIATHVVNANPKIKAVFESWQNLTPNALLSNLQKNQELKSLFLEETPWVMQAQNESQRKKNIAVLFDLNRMSNELQSALNKLHKKQRANGAWTWFDGMPEDRYITQHIVTGMGHLDHLGVKVVREDNKAWDMTVNALLWLDQQIEKDYQNLIEMEKKGYIKLSDNHLGYWQIQYLYARSYFLDIKLDKKYEEAFNYFKGQAQKYWLQSNNKQLYGMIALALHRLADTQTPQDIVKSLREHALNSEEMGMYWKENWGYFWYEMPIETQALLIEVFEEVAQDNKAVEDLKTWLLKQKQTQDWKTTKATAEACYALLLKGVDGLASEKLVEIVVGDKKINPYDESNTTAVEAGTGYFKTSWKDKDISANMGNITVTKKDEGVAWGAVYWQYFEQLDKITSAETPLKLTKKLFVVQNTDKGEVLVPITEQTPIKIGDLVKVRVELYVDRKMEYVHMKDMRASGLEPTQVFSEYKYQGGLGYYESTRDAATHFFFNVLEKGVYVFEYALRATHEGNFSNGITTIQCMYAPEFSSHSEGIRIDIKK